MNKYTLLVHVVIHDAEINNTLGIFMKIRDFRRFLLHCLQYVALPIPIECIKVEHIFGVMASCRNSGIVE